MVKMTLKAARVNAGLNQKAAAVALGVSNKTLCNWENGKSFPNASMIALLCEVYGMRYDDIKWKA